MSPTTSSKTLPLYQQAAEALRPNKGQWMAYGSKGHCVILAGPGSGKTKTLTIKLARMLAEDVRPPRGIACITYSNQCVRELRQRLDRLGVESGRRTVIGTVHSFCLQHIISPYARLAGLSVPNPLKVALESEQVELKKQAVQKIMGVDEEPYPWPSRIDRYRRRFLDRNEPEWRQTDEDTARVVETYEQLLYDRGVIDFDGMVLGGLQLVERHEWIRRALRARFPVLVVDEYQDLGYALHRIVLCLCFKAGLRLVAVGDPDQSIYGFQGATPGRLRDLTAKESVQAVHLNLNYRCGPTIIRASEAALGEERGYESANTAEGTIDFYECPKGIEDQAANICQQIIPACLRRRKGRTLGDIAVLYRDKTDGEKIVNAVRREGWSFIRTDKGNPFRRSPVIYWLQDCAAWCAGGWRTGTPRLSDIVRTWFSFNPSLATDACRRAAQISLVRFLHGHRQPDMPLRDWLAAFLVACLNETLNVNETLRDDKKSVDELAEACGKGRQLEEFSLAAFGGQGGTPDHLNLITLHSAKGLEFEVVIMMGMDQGRMPGYRTIEQRNGGDEGGIREDRRLFYVGLTRAKDEVHMTYSGWYENQYGRKFRQGPSEFLVQVRQELTAGELDARPSQRSIR